MGDKEKGSLENSGFNTSVNRGLLFVVGFLSILALGLLAWSFSLVLANQDLVSQNEDLQMQVDSTFSPSAGSSLED